MIHLTDADKEKIKLLDDIFRTIPVDVIRKWAEADKVVEVLKGSATPISSGIILQVFDDNIRMNSQLIQLQTDLYGLRSSVQTMVKIMNRAQFDPTNVSDIQQLKYSLGIY